MAKFEDVVKSAVCSDAGKMLLPAVPGLAVGALTSWSGPGALAAGAAAGMATSAAQQEFCDGKVDAVKTVVGGLSGGVGTAAVLGGKAVVMGTVSVLGRNPDFVRQTSNKLQDIAAGEVCIAPTAALIAAPTIAASAINALRTQNDTVALKRFSSFRQQELQEAIGIEAGSYLSAYSSKSVTAKQLAQGVLLHVSGGYTFEDAVVRAADNILVKAPLSKTQTKGMDGLADVLKHLAKDPRFEPAARKAAAHCHINLGD